MEIDILSKVAKLAQKAYKAGDGNSFENGLRIILIGRLVQLGCTQSILVSYLVTVHYHLFSIPFFFSLFLSPVMVMPFWSLEIKVYHVVVFERGRETREREREKVIEELLNYES